MFLGELARKILGDRWFPIVGQYYRAFFVDLTKVADSMPPVPTGTTVLDVGGGDGALINILARRVPSARITMIDLSPKIGGALDPEVRERVELLPATSIRDYKALGRQPPDLVVISDVLHHVPVSARRQFFSDLADLLGETPTPIVIKDIEPGSFVAVASYLADRFISGDRTVSLVDRNETRRLMREAFPLRAGRETELLSRNPPNYCLVFE